MPESSVTSTQEDMASQAELTVTLRDLDPQSDIIRPPNSNTFKHFEDCVHRNEAGYREWCAWCYVESNFCEAEALREKAEALRKKIDALENKKGQMLSNCESVLSSCKRTQEVEERSKYVEKAFGYLEKATWYTKEADALTKKADAYTKKSDACRDNHRQACYELLRDALDAQQRRA